MLSYCRTVSEPDPQRPHRLQVFLNLTNQLQQITADEGTVLLTTILDGEGGKVGGPLFLEAGEGLIIALD